MEGTPTGPSTLTLALHSLWPLRAFRWHVRGLPDNRTVDNRTVDNRTVGQSDSEDNRTEVDNRTVDKPTLHLVHIKEGLTTEEALRTSDGIAVVGIFYKTAFIGRPLVALQNGLTQVTKTDASVQIDNCMLSVLLPTDLNSFFRYNGSLTTPDCNEAVVWSVYEVPRFNNAELIQLLRTIQKEDGNLIRTNIRPVQPFIRRA
ncbi:hypothetical protein niasHT_010977 [Heterodera trifolii]|uniref:carbonic anhydrase n=1 Tax=Heterodera trifolii TaxID=157864 RepID=A0ABD2LG98_9BILA